MVTRGRFGRKSMGPGGVCVCPNCGYTTPHTTGNPCFHKKCPECGTTMDRQS